MSTIHFLIILGSIIFISSSAHAVDFDFQPRLETGVMSYSFEQGAHSITAPIGTNDTSGFNQTREEIEFNTTMGFVSGGATLFVDRLFVDVSGQYTFEGSDQLSASESIYDEIDENTFNLSTFTSVMAEYDTHLERADHAVSVGCAVNKRLSVFVGYKWAQVDVEAKIGGPFSLLAIDNSVFNGRIMGNEDIEFKYEGPFVGVTHGWQIDGSSIFQGLVSVNAGLAQLNSKLIRRRNLQLRLESINGQNVDSDDLSPVTLTEEIKGDTLGLTLGLSWRGVTPLKNLSYSIGISGHRYQFDSDDAISPDISETAVSFKIGMAYVF